MRWKIRSRGVASGPHWRAMLVWIMLRFVRGSCGCLPAAARLRSCWAASPRATRPRCGSACA
eukprot:6307626-Prymnesium_polylepis.1